MSLFREEQHFLLVEFDLDPFGLVEGAAQQLLGERVFDVPLYRAPQRTRAEFRLVSLGDQVFADLVGNVKLQLPAEQALAQLAQLDIHDIRRAFA